ncbi:MAG TPA: hypothetical protein VGO47_12690 [Chlamydiales bacterium]|nr:hypothetical protein [Chlamydiales bacterium]
MSTESNSPSCQGESSAKQGTLLTYLTRFNKRDDYLEYLHSSMIKYKEEKQNT